MSQDDDMRYASPGPSSASPGGQEKPKVLIVAAVNGHGGPIASISTVMRSLKDEFQFVLATQLHASPDAQTPSERLAASAFHIPRPRGIDAIRASIVLLRRWQWARRDLTAIHANGLTEAVIVAPLAVVSGVRVVVWVHNSVRPRPFKLVGPLLHLVARRWTWRPVSSLAARLVAGFEPRLLPNPVDDSVLAATRRPSAALRILYFAGTDRAAKGFDLLPDIISATEASGVDYHIFAGAPSENANDGRTLAWDRLRHELSHKVHIRGRTRSPAEAYADADVVIAPSRAESFNRVIAEGLVNGLPFIASDIEPHRELADASGAGLLSPIEQPKDAAALVDRISRDPSLLNKLRCAAKQSSGLFGPNGIADELARDWKGDVT